MNDSMKNFWHEHSLSILAIAILSTWIIASQFVDDQSHWGAFFNNAIADWSGVVAVVLATKYLYEKNSSESNEPPPEPPEKPRWKQLLIEHSLSLFFGITSLGILIVYINLDTQSKAGEITGNILSEWIQTIGLILLTKKFVEIRSKE